MTLVPIATLEDPRVAEYRQLADPEALRQAGLFVAEGRLVLERLLAGSRFRTRSALLTDIALRALQPMLEERAAQIPVFVVNQSTMNAIAGFNIHRGCLALAERPEPVVLDDLPLRAMTRLLVMEGVNNPDNVGGIFRSAAAFNTNAVILGPACGDPLYRKAVRTSMAATLAIPFAGVRDWPGALRELRSHGFDVIALTPAADARPLANLPRDLARVALLIGAEGHGLSADAMGVAEHRVRIPMSGPADSLNVTVAASIALYHFSTHPGT